MTKRIISLIMVIALSTSMFMLVGCGKEDNLLLYTIGCESDEPFCYKDTSCQDVDFEKNYGTKLIRSESEL